MKKESDGLGPLFNNKWVWILSATIVLAIVSDIVVKKYLNCEVKIKNEVLHMVLLSSQNEMELA